MEGWDFIEVLGNSGCFVSLRIGDGDFGLIFVVLVVNVYVDVEIDSIIKS